MAINPATGREYTAAELADPNPRNRGVNPNTGRPWTDAEIASWQKANPGQSYPNDPNLTTEEQDGVNKSRGDKSAVLTKEGRVAMVLAGYAHALEHNSPRTPAELQELRFLFGEKVQDPQAIPEPTKEQLAKREAYLAQQKTDLANAQRQYNTDGTVRAPAHV